MELLGEPQRTFPVIHVTGTNGKTSTARIIEALLRELGLKTGRFTSPHLHSMLERIAVGGRSVDAERFLAAYDEVIPFVEMVDARSIIDGGPAMTYFEVLVAVAYAAFADLPVDVAVVEVGMGGSWDATNVVDAPVSVVTPIDLDHRHFLGNTVEEIAGEKAGIIKADAITVVGVQQSPEAAEVLVERATDVGARILFEGNDFGVTARDVAVGGQQISLRGLAAEYPEPVPAAARHAPGRRTPRWRSPRSRPSSAAVSRRSTSRCCGPGWRASTPRGGSRSCAEAPPCSSTPRTTRPARGRCATPIQDSFTFARLVGVVAVMKDKDAAELLEALEPVLDEVVVTRTSVATGDVAAPAR